MATRTITLVIDGISLELDMDVALTLQQLEKFMKTPDFLAASQAYDIPTVFVAKDDIQFHYNAPEAVPSLKHLSLKQFHPKKKLLFYISKQVVGAPQQQQPLPPPQQQAALKESIIERSSHLTNAPRLISFVVHTGGSEKVVQRTFPPDTLVADLKKTLELTKASKLEWHTHMGVSIPQLANTASDSKKICQIPDLWDATGTIHINAIHHSA